MQSATRAGFNRAYQTVQVDPQKFLKQVTRTHKLPITAWRDMFYLGEEVVTPIANRIIKSSMKTAALEGMGLGMGGMLTIVPDAGILSAITIRMLQRLSLIHGFEYSTDDEVGELWMAAASAAGLDLGRDFVEKQAIERLVPRIIDRIAVKVGAEVAADVRSAARNIPNIDVLPVAGINVYDIMRRHKLVLTKAAVDALEARFK